MFFFKFRYPRRNPDHKQSIQSAVETHTPHLQTKSSNWSTALWVIPSADKHTKAKN